MQAQIAWAQRKEKVLATVQVLDVKDPVLKIEGNKFTFSGKSRETEYRCEVELFAEIDESESRYVVRQRGVEISLKKKDESIWWPRLAKTTTKLHWISVDWAKWVDSSDDEDEKPDFMWDPSEMASFGGDDDDEEDDDDGMVDVQPEEDSKETPNE